MSLMRKVLLAMSTSTFLREQATKRAFIRRSVSAFMPGETVEDALAAAATLKPQRINTILTRLGEGVTRIDEAEQVTQHYLDVLDKVQAAGLDAQISVKPTQLGSIASVKRPGASVMCPSGSTWRTPRTSIPR